jgi:hypothetical protein
LKQIRNGEAYYEGRVNRADVKRKKFPMLEKGGYMEHGGAIKTFNTQQGIGKAKYVINYHDGIKKHKDGSDFFDIEIYKNKIDFEKGIADLKRQGYIQKSFAKGGYMEHGGDVDKGGMIYALREYVSSGEIANKTDVLNYDDIAKIRRIAIQYYMDNGDVPYSFGELNRIMAYANDKFKSGYMEHGGAIKNQYEGREPQDIWDSYTKEQKLHFLYDHHEEINEYKRISSEEEKPWFNVAYNSNWDDLDIDIKNRFANHVRGGQYAKGGMTDHNLMIGDTIKQSFGNILVVENDGKTYLVNINTGQRWTDSEWWSLSKGEITKYTKMAKGGNVYSSDDAYEAIILKDGVEVDRVVLRAKNKGEARMMYEDYHEGKMMKTHGEDITYEIIVAPSKMAQGGEVRNYKTYVEQYPDGKIYVRVKFSGLDKDVQNYVANEANKTKAINFAKRLAEKNNGTYEGFKNFSMAKGGVVYTDLKDIPNLMDRVERGYVTYRGLGAFKEGTEITVDGKKYIVTDDDFNSIARDKDGNMRIRFSAPSRKRYEDGGYMAESGEVFYKESHKMGH